MCGRRGPDDRQDLPIPGAGHGCLQPTLGSCPQKNAAEKGEGLRDVERSLGRLVEHRLQAIDDSPLYMFVSDPAHS